MTNKAQKHIRAPGIMTLSIMILAAIIVLLTRLTDGQRTAKLRESVQQVVGDEWQVCDEVLIQSTISAMSSTFVLKNGNDEAFAVVMRVETLYGPMPCVYVCRAAQEGPADFAGVLSLKGNVLERLKSRTEARSVHPVNYWAERIPSIIASDAEEEVKSEK